jgi:L-cysteine:1D-myo-inositol 2-amino-2-deoxy-alpha-D-glucopyranoside ligase
VKSWNRVEVPRLQGSGALPRIWDTAAAALVEVGPIGTGRTADIYVCGITPYDATHLGHAATYLAYDTLIRLWLDAGLTVRYVQNTTDVDDPLLERAAATGVDWRELASSQTDLFRSDMESLRILPPDHYVAVTERIESVATAVDALLANGTAYPVSNAGDPAVADPTAADIYFDSSAAERIAPWMLGDESHLDRATMLDLSAQRGGDPERAGKRDPLDPLLWRAARTGEPSWASPVGAGRPGWHIECSVIAAEYLDLPLAVKGGGSDLIFPHHEFSGGHTAALTGTSLARTYSHAGLVAYQGEKMSKSLGNLVFVSRLTEQGVDPRAIRLAILDQHYRAAWEWTQQLLDAAIARLRAWDDWAAGVSADATSALVHDLRAVLVNDLDTAQALELVDARIATGTAAPTDLEAIDALLGIRLG